MDGGSQETTSAATAAQTLFTGEPIPLWLDCDTGHDDAFAILLAAHSPRLRLLGISTVHGNASLANTTSNSLSILEAVGRRGVPVYPGAARPFCRDAVHAAAIHGESGLELGGAAALPTPVAAPATHASGAGAVGAMHAALSAPDVRGKGWLVATGALTNVALLFAVHPRLADDVAGLSVMGGAVGGFFSNAPLGRMRERLALREPVYRHFPAGPPDGESADRLVRRFRELGILDDGVDDEKVGLLLDQARRSFGNSTPYAEFNIYCDPESASSLFRNPTLARKTTLIPLDLTHQVLATPEVLRLLQHGSLSVEPGANVSTVRTLFHEILTFFAATYSSQFGMYAGPPLHDPLAVYAVLAPQMFEDQGGERFAVHVVCGADDCVWAAGAQPKSRTGECGRTVVALLGEGDPGVRIPREVDVAAFWSCLNEALASAEEAKRV